MLDQLTVLIKTIHRPWSCARLIQSLDRYAAGVRIHVLDDGQPKRRLSACYPEEAKRIDQLIETKFDIGVSAGRNQLLATVETPYFLLIDDDHVVTTKSDIEGLVSRLHCYGDECDLLAAMSDDNGRPRCFTEDKASRTLYAGIGYHRRDGDVSFCDLVPNTFVAKTDPVRELGWAPFLKVHEHWEFFYRAWQRGLRVAITSEHRFDHRHLHNAAYNHLRGRSWYLRRGLKAHGLRRFLWSSPSEAS
jgi:hypothetical protein